MLDKKKNDLALIDIGKSIEMDSEIIRSNKNFLKDLPGLVKDVIKTNLIK